MPTVITEISLKPLEFQFYRLQAEVWAIFGLAAAILDFWLPLTSHNVCTAILEFLVLENMRLAVRISILFHLQAGMWGTSGFAAAIFDYWLPLTPHSIRITIFEFLILENMDIAAGILILLQAEICGSCGLSAAIFNLWLPVCQKAHIHSARWYTCFSKSPDSITNGYLLFYPNFLDEFKALSNMSLV